MCAFSWGGAMTSDMQKQLGEAMRATRPGLKHLAGWFKLGRQPI
jgi:hypothetical protein